MPKKSVKLISAEGFEFTVDYKAACISNTIKQMLSSEGMQLQDKLRS
jgi:transcription elongation factor B subunit 1